LGLIGYLTLRIARPRLFFPATAIFLSRACSRRASTGRGASSSVSIDRSVRSFRYEGRPVASPPSSASSTGSLGQRHKPVQRRYAVHQDRGWRRQTVFDQPPRRGKDDQRTDPEPAREISDRHRLNTARPGREHLQDVLVKVHGLGLLRPVPACADTCRRRTTAPLCRGCRDSGDPLSGSGRRSPRARLTRMPTMRSPAVTMTLRPRP